jgi:hypothetical protein
MDKKTKKKIKKYSIAFLIGLSFILYNLLLFASTIIGMQNSNKLNMVNKKKRKK